MDNNTSKISQLLTLMKTIFAKFRVGTVVAVVLQAILSLQAAVKVTEYKSDYALQQNSSDLFAFRETE